MTEILNKTLSQIVTEHQQTAPLFEKYHMDFCCKGKRPLREALHEKSSDTALDFLAELAQVLSTESKPETDFQTMKLSKLADYIEDVHHSYVRESMPQIAAYLHKVCSKHGDRFPYMLQVYQLFVELQQEMTQHMLKEERILFPRIRQMEANTNLANSDMLQGPIDVMEDEHETAGSIMEEIRRITANYTPPETACTTFRLVLSQLKTFEEDLHQHVHLENNILFPRAVKELVKA